MGNDADLIRRITDDAFVGGSDVFEKAGAA